MVSFRRRPHRRFRRRSGGGVADRLYGELGYEVFCHPRDAVAVFDAVSAAGEPLGLSPMGLEALDMVRIEAGLIFANYEFSDATDPFEAGVGFTVPLNSKAEDFIGREALIERRDHPRHRLVGLDIAANAVGHGDSVHVGRAQVGVVTSGTRSPLLNRSIALARIDVHHAGTAVEIGKLDGQQKRLPAVIVPFRHYDREEAGPFLTFARLKMKPKLKPIQPTDRRVVNIAKAKFEPFTADGREIPGQSFLQLDDSQPPGVGFLSTEWRRAARASRMSTHRPSSSCCSRATSRQ